MKRKISLTIVSCILVVCMLTISVFARYTAISFFTADYSKSGDTVRCSSTVDVRSGYTYELELTVQRASSSSGPYSDYHTFSVITGVGNDRSRNHEKKLSGVSNNYFYRTKAALTAFDSSGNEVDFDTCYSSY